MSDLTAHLQRNSNFLYQYFILLARRAAGKISGCMRGEAVELVSGKINGIKEDFPIMQSSNANRRTRTCINQ